MSSFILCILSWLAVAVLVMADSYRKKPGAETFGAFAMAGPALLGPDARAVALAGPDRGDLRGRGRPPVEKMLWVGAGILLLLAVGGSVYGVVVAERALSASLEQADAAQKQLAVVMAEQRPWMKLGVSVDGAINEWRVPNAVSLGLKMSLTNVGRAPAFDVRATAVRVVTKDRGAFERERSRCFGSLVPDARARKAFGFGVYSPAPEGDVVFPGDTAPAGGFIHSAIGVMPDEISRAAVGGVPLRFMACVIYRTGEQQTWHRTAAFYDVTQIKKALGGGNSSGYVFRPGVVVPNEQVKLVQWHRVEAD